MKWNEIINTAGEHLAANSETPMPARRILIPLDLVHSTIDPLLFVQGIATEMPICATLLHVVAVNLAPTERRVYEELCSEAQAALCKLAKLFFGDGHETRVSVRIGRPHQQIVLEARASLSELIILSGGKPRSWARLFGTGTAERVVRAAPCPTLVLPRPRPIGQSLPSSLPAEQTYTFQRPEARTRGRQAAQECFAEESNRIHAIADAALGRRGN
jgi:nucleotide-binding universal stress UspA family protein